MKAKKIWSILKGTYTEFSQDNVLRLSAALAYYAMFSIGPLLVIAVAVAGLAFGDESVRRQLEGQLQFLVGGSAAKTISSMMAAQTHGTTLFTMIVGIVSLLLGAGGVFGQLQDALNTIWGVTSRPEAGIWALVRTRFLSLTMVLGTGFLLLVSMALTTFLSAVTGSFGSKLPVSAAVAHGLNFIISFGVISALFAMIFKYLPDVKIPWRRVWLGAMVTAFLFSIGKHLLGLYLGRQSTASAYGAAGSVIVVLLWVYYASVILLVGAEFTHVFAKATGTMIRPKRHAMPITAEARAEQGIAPQPKIMPGLDGQGLPERTPNRPAPTHAGPAVTPGIVISKKPLQFVWLMLLAGFAGGILLRFKSLRKAVRIYSELNP